MKNYFDLYSVPVNFTYHNYYLYPSFWGGIFSLILELLLVAYLAFLCYDMAQREFPELAISTKYDYFPEGVHIINNVTFKNATKVNVNTSTYSNTSFYAAVGIKRKFNLQNEAGYNDSYEINAFQIHIDENGNRANETLSTELCTQFGDGFVTDESFKSLALFNASCITSNFYLKGIYNYPKSKWLEIVISKKTPNNIDSDDQFEFYYQSRSLNTTKYTKNITVSVLEEVFWDVLEDYTKVSHLKVSIDKILTNDYFLPRFIVRKYKEKYALSTKSWSDQTKGLEKYYGLNALLIIRVSLDTITSITERAFHDVLTQLAMIGGLAGVVFPVGFIFVFSIRNFRMTENMMNDCYYIIDPKNTDSIQGFDDFVTSHYNKLIRLLRDKPPKKAQSKKAPKEETIELKNMPTIDEDKSDEKEESNPKKEKLNRLLSETELYDDEGITRKDFNPVELFFTLKRIENLFGLTPEDRINALTAADPSMSLNFQKVDETKYVCYKFIYDSTVYKSQPDFTFNIGEMFSYFFFVLCCCKRKKEVFNLLNYPTHSKEVSGDIKKKPSSRSVLTSGLEKTEEKDKREELSVKEKKYAVFHGAARKLGVDFDLVNILKTIEGFDYFTKVFLEKHQRVLFYSVSKPTIKDDSDDDEDKNNGRDPNDKEAQEFEDIQEMYKNLLCMIYNSKGKLEEYQVRLLELMGRTPEDIQMLNNVILGKPLYTPEIEEETPVDEKDGVKTEKPEDWTPQEKKDINQEITNQTPDKEEISEGAIEKELEDVFGK